SSFFSLSRHHPHLPSFPTRRSSDLRPQLGVAREGAGGDGEVDLAPARTAQTTNELLQAFRRSGSGRDRARRGREPLATTDHPAQDRKSTRLNSSHVKISYAVFCLKK